MMHMHRPQHKAEARPQNCQHMQQHYRIQAAAQPDFDGATFSVEFSQINREMKQLFAIIEVLKLNQYTGL